MEVKTEEKKGCLLNLNVSIPHEEIASSEDEVLKHFQAQTTVPGFRKGKAPRNLIMSRYREDMKKSVLQQVLAAKLYDYIKKENLRTASDPLVSDISYNLGEDLGFKATLELYPEFDLIDYKNIPVEVVKQDVTKEDEDRALSDLQEKYSQFKSSDGIVRDGNFAVIDYELSVDEHPIEKKSSTWVKITEDAYIKEFTEQLKGMKIGEAKEITATLPENYAQKEQAGKKGRFNVKIIDVKERIKPPLDDDFAKSVGPYQTLEELKESIRTNIKNFKDQQSRQAIENQVSEHLLKNTMMDLPPSLLLQEEQIVLKETLQRLHYSGLKEDEIKARIPQISQEAKTKAREHLIIHFILERVIERENITISDDDVEKEYDRMSRTFHISLEKLRERYSSEEEKENLASRIKKIKAVDFIVNSVNIKEDKQERKS